MNYDYLKVEYQLLGGEEVDFKNNLIGQAELFKKIFIKGVTKNGAICGDDMNNPVGLFKDGKELVEDSQYINDEYQNVYKPVVTQSILVDFEEAQNPDTYLDLVQPGQYFHIYQIYPPLAPLIKGQIHNKIDQESFKVDLHEATDLDVKRSKMVKIRFGIQE